MTWLYLPYYCQALLLSLYAVLQAQQTTCIPLTLMTLSHFQAFDKLFPSPNIEVILLQKLFSDFSSLSGVLSRHSCIYLPVLLPHARHSSSNLL